MAAPDAALTSAQLRAFMALHQPALEADEARHTVILGILGVVADGEPRGLQAWTLGAAGQCAVRAPGRPVVLGDLDAAQCRALAAGIEDYPGVVGPDLTAQWFAEAAAARGAAFGEPMPQMIHALADKPRYPGAPGAARPVVAEDAPLLFEWLTAFHAEAVPHDPPPNPERVAQAASEGRYLFWTVDGAPVAMAGIGRRTRHAAGIAPVFTPPAERGRGYAGSVVAALVDRIFAEGRRTACLYTDLRNPYSNRCYAKIGFQPVCASRFYPRLAAA